MSTGLGQQKANEAVKLGHRAVLEQLWLDGEERGRSVASFIRNVIGGLRNKTVLDLGCGAGGLTRVLAGEARSAVGLDNRWTNVSQATGLRPPTTGRAPIFAQGDAVRLPFRSTVFDVVLMSGLLEWMGFALPRRPPRVAQLRTLEEVHRVMAPGGHLFVGIENRWFPKFLIRSPHQELPLALLLPTRLAWALPHWVFGVKVHECLHGYRGLRRLLREAGFADVEFHIPVFNYQFPREIVDARDRHGMLDAVSRACLAPRTRFEGVARGGPWGRAWLRVIATLGVQRCLAPSFFAVAHKPA
jgi:SAM-dependent methyltransferase